MTKNDILRLAREAGLQPYYNAQEPAIVCFAYLVEAHKVEVITAEAYRCGYKDGMAAAAVICENLPVQQEVDVRDECAAAIRERKTT